MTWVLSERLLIQPGDRCKHCEATFTKTDQQYYNPVLHHYLCKGCGEKEDQSKKGHHRFLDQNNLLWLHFQDLDTSFKILKNSIGKQEVVEEETPQMRIHQMICNCCRKDDCVGYRYIYVIRDRSSDGGFLDLCSTCWESIAGADETLRQKVVDVLSVDPKMKDIRNLVFLRVPFNVDGYYAF
eukprot:TRINITY_DN14508_c0_g1_i2.p1 TRINITY_DN14508_c0_g1~~TRINITY_DN14508_c0_g1_i2.p1  ORF type:complete len:183 (+),score=35.07 TRINITY_DN14508_c0_g1_i2:641-1189(+)